MRKIVLSVLSVAGLLAALLVLAGGSVSAETGIARVESTNVRGGTYSVIWKAKAGCDSSADGSVSKVVQSQAVGTDSNVIIGAFTVNDDCQYDFTATYVTGAGSNIPNNVPAGVRCRATVSVTGLDGDAGTDAAALVETIDDDCVATRGISGKIKGPADADGVDNSYHRKAVRARTWVATATPTGKGQDGGDNNGADECAAVTDSDADIPDAPGAVDVEASWTLVTDGLDKDGVATTCQYEIRVTLPDGFVEASKDSSFIKWGNTVWTGGIDFFVKVAQREVFVVQNVTGDAGGAKVAYTTQLACSDAASPPLALPPVVGATGTRGGIETVQGKTLVPLTTGRYDVSEGIAGSMPSTVTGTTGRRAVIAYAVAEDGDNCALNVSANEVPENCTVASASQTVNLLTANDRNIVEFSFRCTATTPTTEAPSDTMATSTTAASSTPPPAPAGNGLSEVDEPPSATPVTSTTMSMSTTTMRQTGPPPESPTG